MAFSQSGINRSTAVAEQDQGMIVARKLFGTSALAVLAWLTGCQNQSTPDPAVGDRLSENPPPKPPSCPNSAELVNITYQGEVVDVRIIQVDDAKFYVPTSWWRGNFPDSYRHEGRPADSTLGIYDPDINGIECPGTVHRFISKRSIFDLGFIMIEKRVNASTYVNPNVSPESSITKIAISRPRGVTDRNAAVERTFEDAVIDWPTAASPSARVVVVPDHLVAVYPWSRAHAFGSARWLAARSSVVELVQWLKTPPKDRDNDRIFDLGGVGQ